MSRMKEQLHTVAKGAAHFAAFDDVPDSFESDEVIETERKEISVPMPAKQRRARKRPQKPKQAQTGISLVENLDLADPAQVAELAYRYKSMNAGAKKLAEEKLEMTEKLEEAERLIEEKDAEIAELKTELSHTNDKLDLLKGTNFFQFREAGLFIFKIVATFFLLCFIFAFFFN